MVENKRNLSYRAGKEHSKILLKSLLSFVETKEGESNDCRVTWREGKGGIELWVTRYTLIELAELTRKYSQSLETEKIRNALLCLIDLKIAEDTRAKNIPKTGTNSKLWSFILKFNTIDDTQRILNSLFSNNGEWDKRCQLQKSKSSKVSQPKILEEQGEDWQDIFRTMLEKHKQLTSNQLMCADEMVFDIDKFPVDLALVERKKPDKRGGDDNPKSSQLYQPEYKESEKFEYKNFLSKLLESQQSSKIAIVGEPGAGKTTLLQRIAFSILAKTDKLPMLIHLGKLGNPIPKFQDFLNNWLEDILGSEAHERKTEFKKLLSDGKVWLLLDGIDEMATDENPLIFIDKWIPTSYQCCSVVLTCRLNVWEANPYALNGLKTYRTLQFSQEKVEEFIKACFKNDDNAQQLLQVLNQPGKERIQDLIKNPLRLMLLCSTWHLREGKLPDTKAELYQMYVDVFYRWKQNKFPITIQQKGQINAKLGELALKAINEKEKRFCLPKKFVEDVFANNTDNNLFDLAINKLAWLNQVGVDANNPNQPVYAFYHATFEEYFAALAIDDWHYFLKHVPENPKQGTYHIFEPQWKEVILLWLGREDIQNKDKEEFIKALVDFQDGCGEWSKIDRVNRGFYEFQTYFLAAQGIVEFNDDSLIDEIVQQVIRYGFGYLNAKPQAQWESFLDRIKYEALNILPTTNTIKAIEGSTAFLSNPQVDSDTRRRAADSLGKIGVGNQTAINSLIKVIRDPEVDSEIRWLAAYSLGKIGVGNQTAIDGLIKVIRDPEVDSEIRMLAAYSLGKIDPGNQTAIEGLTTVILDRQVDSEIRRRAAESLEEIDPGNQTAIKGLTTFLLDPQVDSYTRRWAAYSLKEILVERDMVYVVNVLKNYLSYETYENDFDLFNMCYPIIWDCAKKMTYPEFFYEAWFN